MWHAWHGDLLEVDTPDRDPPNPLVLVLPTRRDDPEARRRWALFARTVQAARPAAAVVLDKTRDGSATAEIRRFRAPGETRALVWRRPSEEAYWRTLGMLRVSPELRIQQVHDDDWWTGVPRVTPGDPSPLVAPEVHGDAIFDSWDRMAGQRSQQALFGAVRGDIWNAFAAFVVTQPAPSGFLDVALLLATQMQGPIRAMIGFDYHYATDNWTPDRIDDTLAAVLESAGWGAFRPFAAAFPIITLDNLAWLSDAWESLPPARRAGAVRGEIAASRPYGPGRLRDIAARTPRAVRPALLRSRRPGNATTTPRWTQHRVEFRTRWPRTAAFLTGAEVLRDIPDVLRLLDAMIAERAGNVEQSAWWRAQIAPLADRLEGGRN